MSDTKPRLVGGVGEINFGKQYRQGNRVYDSNAIAMRLHAQPVGNAGGSSYLYLIDENDDKESDKLTELFNRYDIDEQADFTQTEAEEWATEFAIREKEGNLDPIPSKKSKYYEQHEFTYASLFSGIGGFEQALNKFGGTCVLASEIDKFANQAYEALYGHATAGDITKVAAEDVPDHDVLVGGFPCQSFSVAGKRGGFEDARGTLFFEMARIAKVKQPRVILAENVKGLVGHDKGRTLDTIVKTLNDIGYRVDFDVLNSKYFGVPQNRERIFIVAIREDLVENDPWIIEGNTVVPKGKRRISEYEGVKTFNFDFPEHGEVTTRLRDILEPEVDEKYYLSDDKTAKLVAHLEANPTSENIPLEGVGRLAGLRNRTDRVFAYQGDKKRSTAQENIYLRDEAIADSVTVGHMPKYIDAEPQMVGHVDLKGHDAIKRVYSAEGVSPTLTTMGGGHREPKIAEMKEVAGANNLAYCIDANYAKGIAPGDIGKGRRTHVEETTPRYRIRKLTPLECWRLQGFPDEAHEAVKAAGISDSQRYKQAGNAVTVNVIEALGERIVTYL